jgi:class 3 adenylate cyclase
VHCSLLSLLTEVFQKKTVQRSMSSKSVRSDGREKSHGSPRLGCSLPFLSRAKCSVSFGETLMPADGAADFRPVSVDIHSHFQIEKAATETSDRGVLLLRQSFAPLMVLCLLYSGLFWWWGLYSCLAHQMVAAAIGIGWWYLLLKGQVFFAKVLFLMNWYLSVIVMSMALTSASGLPITSIVLAGLWIILFDLDLSRPILCVCVAIVSSGLFVVFQFYEGPMFLRETLSDAQLVRVNGILFPLVKITTIVFACVLICWLRMINKKREAYLRHECSLVDRIILGLLPSQIVQRLKDGETLIADWRPLACILFMDIVGFTEICSRMPPRQVVHGLVGIFSQIENIVRKYPRIEKVKTIGDAFMCASGLLDSRPDGEDILQVAKLALELQASSFSIVVDNENVPITFRFGIHCGEVIAGVMSRERFTFDVLGDTVNTASRMESTSKPNMIQVSYEVKCRLEHLFEFAASGIHQVKGKGQMETFFLIAAKNSQ